MHTHQNQFKPDPVTNCFGLPEAYHDHWLSLGEPYVRMVGKQNDSIIPLIVWKPEFGPPVKLYT